MTKKSFLLMRDLLDTVEFMTDEEAGLLLKAIIAHVDKEQITLPRELQFAFVPIKNQLSRDRERYQNICERNRLNGAKGGRPEKQALKTISGDLIPIDIEGKHFIYLIYDNMEKQYKIGETQNLIQRRYDIKRPTNDLDIVQFWLTDRSSAIAIERNIIDSYQQARVSGDWFEFSEIQATEVVNYISQKTQSVSKDPKKADNDTDTDTDNDINLKNTPSSKMNGQVPIKKIVDLYHEMLPSLPRVEKVTKTREGYIRQRWIEDLPAIENWENYFDYVSQSAFLMGKTQPTNGRPPFRASLEWLTKPANFAKVAEEHYHGV